MPRKLTLASLTLFGIACANFVIDKQSTTNVTGDGGRSSADGSVVAVPPDATSTTTADVGPVFMPDTGMGPPCSTTNVQIKLSPLDLMVVLDVSGSMDFDEKWTSVKGAMKSFVSNPQFDKLGVGLQYFPLRLQCNVDGYKNPAVPIGVLGGTPDVAPIIASSLDLQEMGGGTPTVPMLEGTVAYLKSWLARPENADHKAVLVVATDGIPDDSCAGVTSGITNSLANAISVAHQAANTDPVVKTFVIGVGTDLTALNQFANAGGTGQALLVDTSQNADLAFFNALTQVRHNALGCTFDVPVGDTINQQEAQVRFVPDDGSATEFFDKVPSSSGCVNGQGWYLDDPVTPTKLLLCDGTCTTVTQGATGHLFVEFACNPT
jgi:hypothetical protein